MPSRRSARAACSHGWRWRRLTVSSATAAGVDGGGGEPAAGADLGELVVVADQQHPPAGAGLAGDDRFEGADVGHAGLVDHQQRPGRGVSWPRRHWSSSECRVRAGMPAPAGQLDRGAGRWGGTDDRVAGLLERGADRVEGVGLAGPGRTDQHRDRPRARRDGADGGELVVAQAIGQPRPVRRPARGAGRTVPLPSRRRGSEPRPRPAPGSSIAPAPHLRRRRRALGRRRGHGRRCARSSPRSRRCPCRAATARIRSGVGEGGRRGGQLGAQQVGDPLLRIDDALDVLGSAVLVEPDGVEPPPPVGRGAGPLPGPARRGARRHPVPNRPLPPRPSSPRRTGRARPPACGAGSPARRPAGLPGCRACRWRPATPRSRASAWRTRRAATAGCRRSPGRGDRAATRPPATRASSSRNAAWNTSPAARAWRYRSAPNRALHRPSLPSARLATRTCQCSRGRRPGRCDAGTPPPRPPTSPAGADRRRARRRGRPATPGCGSRAAP